MKYTIEIEVNVPRDVSVEKMDKPENMKHWQKETVRVVSPTRSFLASKPEFLKFVLFKNN